MSSITEIRNALVEVFDKLRRGEIDAKEAVEINNTAGKIISSAKVQLAYHALRGESPSIPFLGSGTEIEPKTGRAFSPGSAGK